MLPQSLRRASRPLLRSIAHKKPSTLLSQHRNFTRTGAWRASEDADVFTTRYRNTALFKKLADKPTALAALNDFAQVLKDEGSLPVRWLPAWPVEVLTLGFHNRHRRRKRKPALQDANVQTSHELKIQGWCEEGCCRVTECRGRFVFQGAAPRFASCSLPRLTFPSASPGGYGRVDGFLSLV